MASFKLFGKAKTFMTFFTEFDDIEQDKLEEYLESDSFDKVFISLSKNILRCIRI